MEKLTLTDKASLVIFGNIMSKANTFLLLIILARMLSKDDYGTYSQIIMIGTLAYAFFAGSVSDSLYFFLPTLKGDDKKAFVMQTIIILLILGIMGGLLIWMFTGYTSAKFHNESLKIYLPVYSFYVIFWIANDYFIHYLLSSDKIGLSVIVGFFETFSSMACMTFPLLAGKGLFYSFVALAIITLIKSAIYYGYVISEMRHLEFRLSKKILSEQFNYFFPLTLSYWITSFSDQFGKLLLSLFYTPAILAIYAVGSIKIPIWQVLTKSTNAVLRVKFAELHFSGDYDQMLRIWDQSIRKLNLIIFPIVFCLFAVSDPLINLMFTERYSESVVVFKIFLLYYLTTGISTSLIPVSLGKTHILTIASILTVVINLGTSIIFLKFLGYSGLAVATVFSCYAVSFYYFVKIKRMLNIPISRILPWNILFKLLAVNGISLAVAYPLNWLGMGALSSILAVSAVFSSVYIILVLKTGLFNKYDKEAILKLLKLKRITV